MSMEKRIEELKQMHERMMNMNHEDAYMWWIEVVPDEPSEDDFRDIAEDDESFAEVKDLYLKILTKYSKYNN